MTDPAHQLPPTWLTALAGLHEGVVAVTEAGAVCFLNGSARRLLAWPEDRPLGTPLEALLVEGSLEAGERSETFCARLREQSQAADGRFPALRLHRTDGVELEMECSASEARDDSGARFTLLLLRHPSAPVDFPEDRASQGSYQLVFENAPMGIFHFDPRGVITACNERFVEILGSSRQLLLGLDMRTLPNPEMVRCVKEAISGQRSLQAVITPRGVITACNERFVEILGSSRQLLLGLDMRTLPNPEMVRCVKEAIGGQRSLFDGEYISATGGRHRIVRVAFAPILTGEDEVSGGVGIVEDVSDARRAQTALSRADRMASLGTLAAGIAHEINNPLAYVLASLEYALRTLPRPKKSPVERSSESWLQVQQDALLKALEGSERVRRIVSDLGTFSRPVGLSEGSADLRRVLDSAAALSWNEIRHRAHLVKNYGETARARGEEPRLVQVFLNLFLNAAQAIPDGDSEHNLIEVGVTESDGFITVEVRDTGGGIAPEIVDHIFEPFFTTKAVGEGTGLGLSVCHGIITSLGGKITAHTSAGGTTMKVKLPLAESEAARDPAPPREKRRPVFGPAPMRMLFIDDEVRLAETLAIALEPHQVISVTSGNDALALMARDREFSLVLCDLMIPDLSGPEIYQRVRKSDPELADRFVFVSGGAFTERARAQLAETDVPLLAKPFDIEAIEKLLEERRDQENFQADGI